MNIYPITVYVSGMVRLVGGEQSSFGRVEVFYHGVWGRVCDDYWDHGGARVVCRQLGYDSGVALYWNNQTGNMGSIRLKDVLCSGSESNLLQCSHTGWSVQNCAQHRDAGVDCFHLANISGKLCYTYVDDFPIIMEHHGKVASTHNTFSVLINFLNAE